MVALAISAAERSRLRAQAHPLHPVVTVGTEGASEPLKRELDQALATHGLVKVRVFSDDRKARDALFAELAEALAAAPVQHIGKLLVFWRPPARKPKPERDDDRMAGPKIVKVLKFAKSGNHRPRVLRVRVAGNMRLAAGGELKRARHRAASIKKKAQT